VIAVVRLSEAVGWSAAARWRRRRGAVEVTLTTPGAIDAIADLASDKELAGCVIVRAPCSTNLRLATSSTPARVSS